MRKSTAHTAPAVIAANFFSSYPDVRACAYVGTAVGSQVGLFINWRCNKGSNLGNRSPSRCHWNMLEARVRGPKIKRAPLSKHLAAFLRNVGLVQL